MRWIQELRELQTRIVRTAEAMIDEDSLALRTLRVLGIAFPPRPVLGPREYANTPHRDANAYDRPALQLQPGEAPFADRWWGVFEVFELAPMPGEESEGTTLQVRAIPRALYLEEGAARAMQGELMADCSHRPWSRYIVSRVDLIGLTWHSLLLSDPRSAWGGWATRYYATWYELGREVAA